MRTIYSTVSCVIDVKIAWRAVATVLMNVMLVARKVVTRILTFAAKVFWNDVETLQ